MPRWLAHLLVVVGWLLTPVLGWGASFVGLWVGAAVGMRFANPLTMLAIAGAGAALFGVATLITWLHAPRRSTAPLPLRTELFGALPLALLPAALRAQGRDWELHLGRWYNGNGAGVYEFRTSSRLAGPLTHGFGVAILVSDTLGRRRAFYGMGYEIQGWRSRSGFAPYALAGLALGLSTDTSTQQFAAQWSVGAGLEWRPFSRFAVGAEARYRLEDRGPRGFWKRATGDRNGVSVVLGATVGLGKGAGGSGRQRARGDSGERGERSERGSGRPGAAAGGAPLPPLP